MAVKKKVNKETTGEVFDFVHGYKDADGTLHKDFELVEMTGADEEAISRGEIRNNGSKVARVLLDRCCIRVGTLYKAEMKPQEWTKIFQTLEVGDLDVMMMRLREISIGETIKTQHVCPNPDCKAEINTEIDIDELQEIPFDGEEVIEFELPKGFRDKEGNLIKKGKMRRPNGLDREVLDPIIKKNIGLANTMMLARCVLEFEGSKVYDDIIRKLTVKDRNYLLDLVKEHNYGLDLSVELTCPNCGETFKASLNATNFI